LCDRQQTSVASERTINTKPDRPAVLDKAGGGYGLFTGCAAGDTGASIIVKSEIG